MLQVLAVVLAAVGYILAGSEARTGTWGESQALGLAAPACLALHLSGVTWSRKD